MAATALFETHQGESRTPWRCVPVVLALLVMYVPTILGLKTIYWAKDDESQGPIILAVVLWLLWRERHLLIATPTRTERGAGVLLLGVGLVLYVIGRSQEFFQFDIAALCPLLLGLALLLGGTAALRRYWFPALFVLFVMPVPPSLMDQILVPLKAEVSQVVADLLYAAGYPISRIGVVLVIGQYQLLIADACSGLRSMFSLCGIGLLYVYLMQFASRWLNLTLICATIPIAFAANILRVMALVLITYYFGDNAGRDFHDLAGYFEIVLAFCSFFLMGSILSKTLLRPRALSAP